MRPEWLEQCAKKSERPARERDQKRGPVQRPSSSESLGLSNAQTKERSAAPVSPCTICRVQLPPLHLREWQDRRGLKIGAPHERQRFRRPPLTVHPGILPLDRKRPGITGPGKSAEHRVEIDVAPPRGDEVPTPAPVAEFQVRAQDAAPAVERPAGILDVHVVDPVAKFLYEGDGVEKLG